MQGLVCAKDVGNLALIDALRDQGLLTVGAAENVIRLLPPLIVEKSHIDEAIDILDTVAETWEASHAA
jgi:acetylornithine/N-succinyldiaminopimelate aminotransferase